MRSVLLPDSPEPTRAASLPCLLGWRVGKGEGYADLEYAMMVSMGAVSQGTPVVTIVHDCQVLPGSRPSRAATGHGA